MGVEKPYFRTVRQLSDGSYQRNGNGEYIRHTDYAKDQWHFKRSFQIIDNDFADILNYIELSSPNLPTFSFKVSGLLVRICIEIEANFKAVLKSNIHDGKEKSWNIVDYRKLEKSHFLSQYEVKFPLWIGPGGKFKPFGEWSKGNSLKWYQAYNMSKHDRHGMFKQANFGNLVSAYSALSVLIWSRFMGAESPGPLLVSLGANYDTKGYQYGPLKRVLVKAPKTPVSERYSFDWQDLRNDPNPFQKFDFS